MATTKFETIEQYLSTFPPEVQQILEKIRTMVKDSEPSATERISYNIPGFFLNGKYFVYMSGYKNHVSLYPIPTGDDEFQKSIEKYKKGKGTLQFQLKEAIPWPVIKTVIEQSAIDNRRRLCL